MNRQIKFRFRKATGETACCTLEEILRHSRVVPIWVYEYPECPRDEFTGLHDSAGKEIYEKDIVKNSQIIGIHKVEYIDGAFHLVAISHTLDLHDEDIFGSVYPYIKGWEKHSQIIGDEFTTPELINLDNQK